MNNLDHFQHLSITWNMEQSDKNDVRKNCVHLNIWEQLCTKSKREISFTEIASTLLTDWFTEDIKHDNLYNADFFSQLQMEHFYSCFLSTIHHDIFQNRFPPPLSLVYSRSPSNLVMKALNLYWITFLPWFFLLNKIILFQSSIFP